MASAGDAEQALLDAIAKKDIAEVQRMLDKKGAEININLVDKDELSPLQHACHIGSLEITRLLLDHGADMNFVRRADGYTALMFAALGSRVDIVRLLLERGVDTSVENCVHRTAAQMAAFVGQHKVVSMINSWVPYDSSVEPYTHIRPLETEPRIPSEALGRLLHNFVVYPSLHPIRLMLFVKEHPDMTKYGSQFAYVLDDLCSKSTKPPTIDETLSLKYHYLLQILKYCLKALDDKKVPSNSQPAETSSHKQDDDTETTEKALQTAIRRLIKRAQADDVQPVTPKLEAFITECIYKYPYTHLAIFRTMTFALSKRVPNDRAAYIILNESLNGPRFYGHQAEACSICLDHHKTKQCSKCHTVYYCGQSCQMLDWFQHKKVCKGP